MPPPLPRRSGWTYSSLVSSCRISLPRKGCRVGLRIVLFEACSAFTHVAACTLARSPIRDPLPEGFSHFVTSMTAPVASGGSEIAGWAFHPLERCRLSTAHTLRGHCRLPRPSRAVLLFSRPPQSPRCFVRWLASPCSSTWACSSKWKHARYDRAPSLLRLREDRGSLDPRLQERACEKCAVSGGSPSHVCIDSSQPDEVGAGKLGSAKQPTAMPQVVGLRSPSQRTLVPQFGQK
jgi:hypothetical protein